MLYIFIFVLIICILFVYYRFSKKVKIPKIDVQINKKEYRISRHLEMNLPAIPKDETFGKSVAHAYENFEFITPQFRLLNYILSFEAVKDVSRLKNRRTSTNWSGFALERNDLRYVAASWKVPTLISDYQGKKLATQWVGLGGCPKAPLIQAGTDTWQLEDGSPLYCAWFEMIQPYVDIHPIFITNFPIDAEDVVHVSVEFLPGKQSSARFCFLNFTKKTMTSFFVAIDGSLQPISHAEWIVEKVHELPLAEQEGAVFVHCMYGHDGFEKAGELLSIEDEKDLMQFDLSEGKQIRIIPYLSLEHHGMGFEWKKKE